MPRISIYIGADIKARMDSCPLNQSWSQIASDAFASAIDSSGVDIPAYPLDHPHESHNSVALRDYFAAKAMAALIVAPLHEWPDEMGGIDSVSCAAYKLADSMLSERVK